MLISDINIEYMMCINILHSFYHVIDICEMIVEKHTVIVHFDSYQQWICYNYLESLFTNMD